MHPQDPHSPFSERSGDQPPEQPGYPDQPPTGRDDDAPESFPQYILESSPPAEPPPQQYPYRQSGHYPVSPGMPHNVPVTAVPMNSASPVGPPFGPPVGPPAKSRKTLYMMISVCVVLALAFASGAYFLYFSRDSPMEVIEQYMTHAANGDFEKARELACDDAGDVERFNFQDATESESAGRLWGNTTWELRFESTNGSKATVIGEVNIDESVIDDGSIEHMRNDFSMERVSNDWCLKDRIAFPIISDGSVGVNDCVDIDDWPMEPVNCDGSGELYAIVDDVSERTDCPDPEDFILETENGVVLCLKEQ